MDVGAAESLRIGSEEKLKRETRCCGWWYVWHHSAQVSATPPRGLWHPAQVSLAGAKNIAVLLRWTCIVAFIAGNVQVD